MIPGKTVSITNLDGSLKGSKQNVIAVLNEWKIGGFVMNWADRRVIVRRIGIEEPADLGDASAVERDGDVIGQ